MNWSAPVVMFRWMGAWIYDETIWRFTQPMNYDTLRNNAPLIVFLVVVSGILLARGRRWMGWLTLWLLDKTAMRGRNLISGGLISLGQVFVPVVGAAMLAAALGQTALFGPIMMQLFELFPYILFTILLSWWLGGRIFPTREGVESALNLAEEGRAEGRFHALMMGIALGAQQVLTIWILPRAQDFWAGRVMWQPIKRLRSLCAPMRRCPCLRCRCRSLPHWCCSAWGNCCAVKWFSNAPKMPMRSSSMACCAPSATPRSSSRL